VGQKSGPQTHDHNSVKSYPIKKFTGKFPSKLAVKWIIKIPSHIAYFATGPGKDRANFREKQQQILAAKDKEWNVG